MSTTFWDEDSSQQQQSQGDDLKRLNEYKAQLQAAKEIVALQKELGLSEEEESGPSVPGGSPALANASTDEDEIAVLRERTRRNPTNQNWSNYLRAKYAEAGVAYPGDE